MIQPTKDSPVSPGNPRIQKQVSGHACCGKLFSIRILPASDYMVLSSPGSQRLHKVKSIGITMEIFSLTHPGTSVCLNHTTTWLSPLSKIIPSLEDPPLPTALFLTNSVLCSHHHCESFQDFKVFLILCSLPPSPRNTPLCELIKGHEPCTSV